MTSKRSWRELLPVHPAADLFPLMEPDELKALGEDIKKNGLRQLVVMLTDTDGDQLLDGRNRLDAMELVGMPVLTARGQIRSGLWLPLQAGDPYAYVISANIQRRHLTADQRHEFIAAVLKAQPEKSNRAIAKQVKADDKTVGAVRKKLEPRADIPHVATVTDSKNRKQPAKKARAARAASKPKVDTTTPPTATLPPTPGDDVDPNSSGELERLRARIVELEDAVRLRDHTIAGLRRRIAELEHAAATGAPPPPPDDDDGIPPFLRRAS